MSDLHVGEGLFRPELLTAAIAETNELAPDLVVVAGDLTMDGYRATMTPATSGIATSRTSSARATR